MRYDKNSKYSVDSAAEYGIGKLLDGIELSDLRPDVDPVEGNKADSACYGWVSAGLSQEKKTVASLDWTKK